MRKPAAILLAVAIGAGVGWAAGHLGVLLGGAELLAAGVLGAVLELWING